MKKIAKTVVVALISVFFLSACATQKSDDNYKDMVNMAVKADKEWHKGYDPESPYYKPETAQVYQDDQDKNVYYVRFDHDDTIPGFWKIKSGKAKYLYDPNGNKDDQDQRAVNIMKMEQVYQTKSID